MGADVAAMQAELDERRSRAETDPENAREIRRLRKAIGASRWRGDPPVSIWTDEPDGYENEPTSDPSPVTVEMVSATAPLFKPSEFDGNPGEAPTGSGGVGGG